MIFCLDDLLLMSNSASLGSRIIEITYFSATFICISHTESICWDKSRLEVLALYAFIRLLSDFSWTQNAGQSGQVTHGITRQASKGVCGARKMRGGARRGIGRRVRLTGVDSSSHRDSFHI